MTELLTAAQMRAIEQAAIDCGEVTGLELMERAGKGVVEAIFEEWPELAKTDHRAVVLCGPGNNGGDGFVVARLLKEWGWEVEVFLYGDAGKLPVDAKVNYERWGEMGEVLLLSADQVGWPDSVDHDVVIEAVFGIGLNREAPPLSAINSYWDTSERKSGGPFWIAVDIPAGQDANTGLRVGGDQVAFADLTVTFHAKKRGHVLGEGEQNCGKTVVKDIGLGKWDFAKED